MAAQEQFDPYRKWLGIPPAEQPPSHYRLLGIAEFEDDPDVISHAADRSMAHVRTFQAGARSELSQQILNELATARRVLLGSERAEYDAQLRKTRAASVPPPPPGMLPPGAPPRPVPVSVSPLAPPAIAQADVAVEEDSLEPSFRGSSSTSSAARRITRKQSSPPLIPMLGVVAAVLLVVAIAVFAARRAEVSDVATPAPKPAPTKATPAKVAAKPEEKPVERLKLQPDPQGVMDESPSSSHLIPPKRKRADRLEQPAETYAQAMDDAEVLMQRNDPLRARRKLQEADRLARDNAQRLTVERWLQMADYLEGFVKALTAGAERLEPGTNFLMQIGDTPTTLTFRKLRKVQRDRELIFDTNQGEMRRRLSELTSEFAMPIARPMLPDDRPTSKLYIAAFHTMHFSGDKETAKLLWDEALQAGLVEQKFVDEWKLAANTRGPRAELAIVQPPGRPGEPFDSDLPDSDLPDSDLPDSDLPDSEMPANLEGEPTAASKAGGTPIPEGEALQEAKRLFRDVYREKLAKAKTSKEKTDLSQELHAAGKETDRNPAQKYVLLSEALALAVELANAPAFMPIVDDLANQFAIDRMSLQAESLEKAVKTASSPEQGRELYKAASAVFYEAKQGERFDVAASIARSAAMAARRAQDPAAQRQAEAEARKLEGLKTKAESKEVEK